MKFGELKGTDKFGNKYYEDLDLPFGQHRWVEYSNIHDPDATMIQPEWHGWMHHMFDETPDQITKYDKVALTATDDAIYDHHVGKIGEKVDATEQVNQSQLRARGYKVGARNFGVDEKDKFYKQPGHALSDEVAAGRFTSRKGTEVWKPSASKKN